MVPMASIRSLGADIRPLQQSPEYRRLWLGSALSSVGNSMTMVAIPIQVYGITHSSLAVGLLGLPLALPLLAVGLLGGSIADAVDRRKLVLLTSCLLAFFSLLFAAQAYLNLRSVPLLYALVALDSALAGIDSPARRTFIPRLLPEHLFPAASALSFLSMHVSLIVGPLLAGTLIAGPGLGTVYAIDAVTFIAAIYSVLRLPPMSVEGGGIAPGIRSVLEGLNYVRRHRIIATCLLADSNATVFGMPFALFPALAATHFGGGARTVGLLYAGPAIGGVVVAALSGPLSDVRRQGLAMLLAIAVWGAAIAGFGLTRSVPLAVLLLAVAGGADVVNGVFRLTIVQAATPDGMRGRMNSIGFVVGAGVPKLGDVEAGLVAQLTSPVFSAISGGLACVVGVTIIGLASPAFARYTSPVHADEAATVLAPAE